MAARMGVACVSLYVPLECKAWVMVMGSQPLAPWAFLRPLLLSQVPGTRV